LATILHIESATLTCSISVAKDGNLLSIKESHDKSYVHSEKLVVYIDQALHEADLKPTGLDAICVTKGPGSYTGLRIGVSAAKGMCYGLNIPLLSVGSLESMAHWAKVNFEDEMIDATVICPMIDARRMEVYMQLFDAGLNALKPVVAEIIDEQSFASELEKGKVIFFGDGAQKCSDVITHPNAVFLADFKSSSQGMMQLAEAKLAANQTEDVAYFEPYYLKDFVAGKPKKLF
jgi:tRNA threonylcarbamoyladenosine biosynthesis protein TsaB